MYIIDKCQFFLLRQSHYFTDVYPGQPPPPYDSQGETYRIAADDEADTSPMDMPPITLPDPLNSFRDELNLRQRTKTVNSSEIKKIKCRYMMQY